MTENEKTEFVNASETILNNIKYIYVDEKNFVKDNDLFTIQIVIVKSNYNHISKGGQVVHTNKNEIDNLDTEELITRYLVNLTEAYK